MIRVTHKAGFTGGTKEIIVKDNKIVCVDEKGKEGRCRLDAEWLIRQAASKDTDLRFEFITEKPAVRPHRSKSAGGRA